MIPITSETTTRLITYPKKNSFKSKLAKSWEQLDNLGKSKILRFSWLWLAIVPIASRAFEKVESLELTFLGDIIYIDLALPFSWHLLFASSLFFAAAAFVYSLKCPEIVAKYDRFSDMKTDLESDEACQSAILISYFDGVLHNNNYNIKHAQSAANIFTKDFPTGRPDSALVVEQRLDGGADLKYNKYELLAEFQSDAFRRAFVSSNNMHQGYRILAYLLYIIGFLLFAGVLLQNILFVVSRFVDQYYSWPWW